MQALVEWARMDGYGGYVWSVLGFLIIILGYEVGRLKFAQRRSQRTSEFDL